MPWHPRRLTAEQLEERRLAAARLLEKGYSQADVARKIGVSTASVCYWAKALKQRGRAGLRQRARTGRPPQLTQAEWGEVAQLLSRGAREFGFETERWTLKRIAQLISRRFGVHYHPNYLAVPLHRMGFSPQRPLLRARERDEELIKAWLKRDWPRMKRGLDVGGRPSLSWTRQDTRFRHPQLQHGLPSAMPLS